MPLPITWSHNTVTAQRPASHPPSHPRTLFCILNIKRIANARLLAPTGALHNYIPHYKVWIPHCGTLFLTQQRLKFHSGSLLANQCNLKQLTQLTQLPQTHTTYANHATQLMYLYLMVHVFTKYWNSKVKQCIVESTRWWWSSNQIDECDDQRAWADAWLHGSLVRSH